MLSFEFGAITKLHLLFIIARHVVLSNGCSVLVSLFVVLVAYFKWSFGYWDRRGVAAPTTKFPFGNSTDLFLQTASFGDAMKDVYFSFKEKGLKYCGYYFLNKPTIVFLDPDLIKAIMTKDFAHFTDHGDYVNEKNDPLSGNLFSLKGIKWKNLRAKLTPTFTSGKMKMMFQTLVDCSSGLSVVVKTMIGNKEDIDIKEVVGRFSTDVIGSCAFGIECNSLQNPDSEFRTYGKKVFEGDMIDTIVGFLAICFPSVLDTFKIPLTNTDVSKFFMGVVKDTVEYREKHNAVRKDFMHLLIQMKNNIKINEEDNRDMINNANETVELEIGKSLTIEELSAQAFVFFLAGFETSSTTLTFCFYELVSNIEIQNNLRKEINDILEKHGGKITYDAIMEMIYMDNCIYETLRKYPPIPLLTRECTQEYQLPGGVKLEKGTLAFIPILGIQRDPAYYPDPEKFDPARFSLETRSERRPFTWLPFGEGPRACIGLRFGMMQTKVALIVLLKSFKFSLSSRTQMPLKMDPKSFVLAVDGGVWLNAEPI